jgi:hypothetical protein
MLDTIKKSGTAPQMLIGSLVILESLIGGTPADELCMETDGSRAHVKTLVASLLENDLAGMCLFIHCKGMIMSWFAIRFLAA